MAESSRPHRARPPTYVEHVGPLDPDAIAFQQEIQDGMITRSQLQALGATPADIERMLRRKELVRLAPAVFVDHTGVPTWNQRAWTAVMHAWPSALSHESVWKPTQLIHVAVGSGRNLDSMTGIRWHRMRGVEARVNWRRAPPRVQLEHAALDAAAVADDDLSAVAVLTSVVQQRLTTYGALDSALAERSRLARGRWMREVLQDLSLGTNSVLEHEYLVRVERPHGLPPAVRQQSGRAGDGWSAMSATRSTACTSSSTARPFTKESQHGTGTSSATWQQRSPIRAGPSASGGDRCSRGPA